MNSNQILRWIENRKESDKVTKYLESRGFSDEILDTFQIGYESSTNSKNKGRIIFPIFDTYGNYLGYQARAFDTPKDEPKYKISTGLVKNEVLYGLHLVKESAYQGNYIVLTEGNPDVISLWQYGIPAVAPMGTSLSKYQAYLIARYVDIVVMVPNNDEQGMKAAKRSSGILANMVSRIEHAYLPEDVKDVNELMCKSFDRFKQWATTHGL